MKKEIYQNENYDFYAKVHIIFITSSAHTFALLDPANLPTQPIAIDVWILRNQNVILTTKYQSDSGLNWQFSTFTQGLKSRFNQDITFTKQAFNQVLVLRNSIFSFANFDSEEMFLCKNSSHLFKVAVLFAQIIEQENSFLTELTSFQSMLYKAKILTTTILPIGSTRPKRDEIIVQTKNLTVQSSAKMSNIKRLRRNIGDIFSPYSVTSIGDTANQNYKRMNQNFQTIHITEQKLSHAQKSLADNIDNLQSHEIGLLKKEIFLELRTLKDSSLNDFIFDRLMI